MYLKKYQYELLTILGDSTIQSLDVFVAALVVYENSVIGYNTVNHTNNIGGHAEINAISDAVSNQVVLVDSIN